jgi:hypothetical protein
MSSERNLELYSIVVVNVPFVVIMSKGKLKFMSERLPKEHTIIFIQFQGELMSCTTLFDLDNRCCMRTRQY